MIVELSCFIFSERWPLKIISLGKCGSLKLISADIILPLMFYNLEKKGLREQEKR